MRRIPWASATYQIAIEGDLGISNLDRFEVMNISYRKRKDQSIVTFLRGHIENKSDLTCVLNGLAEMHLPILAINNLGNTYN